MDSYELKKEQLKLAPKVVLNDNLARIKTIGAAECMQVKDKLLACVIVCQFPSFEILEKQTYLLHNPLPYKQGFLAYREMPAIIEAYNQLEQEPDILLLEGPGILHPRKIGLASHLGLILNKPTIGVTQKLILGNVEKGKVMVNGDVLGFEIKTREHANSIYVSPGHLVSLGTVINLISQTIKHPHKMPEPLHLARKIIKKKVKKVND